MSTAEELLTRAGVKPTSNRILVLRALAEAPHPVSLGELEEAISTLEKSSILRVLNLLLAHHMLHSVEDGRGVVKYELCHADHTSGHADADNDLHVHFYCHRCQRIYCFEDTPVPPISLPAGYEVTTVNYMLKGLCPRCSGKN